MAAGSTVSRYVPGTGEYGWPLPGAGCVGTQKKQALHRNEVLAGVAPTGIEPVYHA